MKSLVVYYSRTGNAKFVAETVAAELGSDIEEVVDLKKREGKLGWMSAGRDASGGKQTEIAPTTKNPKDYDFIVIGTPVWAWNPSAAIRTYLSKNDLSGKKVALFFTLDNNLRQAIEKTKAKEMKDMGRVMAELNPKIKGRADGGEVSKIIKEILAK